MANTLGSLVVSLAVDTARWQGDLGRAAHIAEVRMRNIKDTASRALGAVSVLASAAGVAIVASFKSATNAADELNKLSQKVGIATEELSALKHAAELSDVGLDQLRTGLVKMSKEVAAAAGGSAEAVAKFSAIGVSVTDAAGKVRGTSAIFRDVAERFSQYEDGATKAALATEFFGKAGADIIPLLNLGADGLQRAADEAERFGLIVGTDAAQRAEEFNDNMSRMGAIARGVSLQMSGQMTPTLIGLQRAMLGAANNSNLVASAAASAATGLRLLVSSGVIVTTIFQGLGQSLGAVGAALVAIAHGEFRRAASIIKEGYKDIREIGQTAATALLDVWEETGDLILSTAPETSDKIAAPVVMAAEKVKDALKDIRDSLKEVYTSGLAALRAQESPGERILRNFEDQRYALEKLAETYPAFADAAQEAMGRLVATTQEELDELARLPGGAKEATDKMSVFAEQAARNMQTYFADFLFDPFEDGIRGMLKGFVDVLRRMVAEAAAARIFDALGLGDKGGGILGVILGGIFGAGTAGGSSASVAGARATGGPVSAGSLYQVNESGKEYFRPSVSGEVIPLGKMDRAPAQAAPQVTINTSVDARGASVELVQRLPAILREANRAAVAEAEALIVGRIQRRVYDLG